MNPKVRIAFCTDFSVASDIAVKEAVNVMSQFEYDVDIIHLVEEDEKREEKYLENYKKELTTVSKGRRSINSFLFSKGELISLKDHLINTKYTMVILGLSGLGGHEYWGSFAKFIYPNLNKDLALVPFGHELNRNNRGLLTIEHKNFEQIYVLKKYRKFLEHSGGLLRILFLSENELNLESRDELKKGIVEILHGVNLEIIYCDTNNVKEVVDKELENVVYDFHFYFEDDVFDRDTEFSFNNIPLKSRPKMTSFRIASSPELIDELKAIVMENKRKKAISL